MGIVYVGSAGYGKILILFFVSLHEPSTLRLFNLTNTEHFFGLCLQVLCQAGPP